MWCFGQLHSFWDQHEFKFCLESFCFTNFRLHKHIARVNQSLHASTCCFWCIATLPAFEKWYKYAWLSKTIIVLKATSVCLGYRVKVRVTLSAEGHSRHACVWWICVELQSLLSLQLKYWYFTQSLWPVCYCLLTSFSFFPPFSLSNGLWGLVECLACSTGHSGWDREIWDDDYRVAAMSCVPPG